MSSYLESLASFAPQLILRRANQDPKGITAATVVQFPSAVLFADISGFTALTERLAARGPAGAEDLTELLNLYFGQMIDLIGEHGGDVVKFAGDALVALWPSPDEAGVAILLNALHRAR
jgi:class 3 adenylate cyclase